MLSAASSHKKRMFANSWSRLLRRSLKRESISSTDAEIRILNQLDIGVEKPLTAMDCERLLTEDGGVVGATAEIDLEHNQVRLTPTVLPKGFYSL